jgi:uncharacterized protein (TIGR02147 family)
VSEATPGRGRIFDYLDYRAFLRDRYAARKRKSPAFSYRFIAGKAGLDPGSLYGVLKGHRKLDPALARSLAQAFGLNEHEKEYFEALVLYCQAKNHTERTLLLENLLGLRGNQVRKLEERQMKVYRKWYYVALRELLSCMPVQGDIARLGKMLRPAISPQETREAVQLLLELGLVEKDDAGIYKATENLITSGENVRAAVMNNFHIALGRLALRAISESEPATRDFSTLTLNCSLDTVQDVKAILRQARRDILQRAGKDVRSDVIFQINFQAFPLSQRLDQGAV